MDVFEAIRERRSIRSFKPDTIPDETLNKILEAAQWAPSAGNCQARDFIVVKDPEVKRRLCRAALDQWFIEEAPVDIVVCANEDRSASRYGNRGRRLYCLLDAAAAVQNLLLAAHALGLGACWIGAYHDEMVSETLNLPDFMIPIAIIPIGYPAEEPWAPSRISLERLVHKDRYEAKKWYRFMT
ncbi:MAG: nitroreductase family protein [Candidatus Geothermarchaeales archaeon]